MKRMMLVAAACAMVTSPSALLADSVESVNVVGYYTVTIPANAQALLTPVLEDMDGATVADLFADLPVGASVSVWDREIKAYVSAQRTSRGGWGVIEDRVVLRGDAVFVSPNTVEDFDLTFMGEVPGAYNLAATTTVHNIDVVDAVGYAYPIDVAWSNTTLYTDLAVNSGISLWDVETQAYVSYQKTSRGGWGAFENGVIKAGTAFWVGPTNVETIDWVEEVPYEL